MPHRKSLLAFGVKRRCGDFMTTLGPITVRSESLQLSANIIKTP